MQTQRRRGLRDFVQTPPGRIALLTLTICAVFAAYYVTVLIAIPVFLIVGLWLSIHWGLKRPRYLALCGLVVLLLVAPPVSYSYTLEALVPPGVASSGPSGVDWSVTVDNTTVHALSGDITFQLPSGTDSYQVSPVAGYRATLSGRVTVATNALAVPIAFTPVRYAVTFTEAYLPSGTSWGVVVGSTSTRSTTSTITVDLPNGTYAYRLDAVPEYSPPYPTGAVDVNGGPVAVAVAFARTAYPVTFTETGLPAGTPWTLTAHSANVTTTESTIRLALPNGTFAYHATSSPEYLAPTGQTVVVLGAPTVVLFSFVAVSYPVTISENGLPSGTAWSVSLDGSRLTSTTASNSVDLINGTYPFQLGAVTGYSPVTANGTVTVNGNATGAHVSFNATRFTFPVSFAETGLAPGTAWGVTIGPTTVQSTDSYLRFNLTNGTAAYTVQAIPGYLAPAAGSADVHGLPVGVTVAYKTKYYRLQFVATHLPAGAAWNVTLDALTRATLSSTSARIEFNVTNGTYPFTIGPPSDRTPPSTSAVVVVDGAGRNYTVPFAETTYAVTFEPSGLPTGGASAILQNATISPFHRVDQGVFTWSVTVEPQYLPSGTSTPLWLDLYISTCPGATSPNGTLGCSAGSYSFVQLRDYLCGNPTTLATCEASAPVFDRPMELSFNYTVGPGIWDWQMGLAVESYATHTPTYTLLVGDPTYDGLEGPVVGSVATVFEVVLPSVYLETFLYLGLPYYAVLLLYAFLKNRERRREDSRNRSAGPIPPTSGAEAEAAGAAAPLPTSGGTAPPAAPGKGEQACPHCGAVVYPGETKCWKCGTALGSTPSSPGSSS